MTASLTLGEADLEQNSYFAPLQALCKGSRKDHPFSWNCHSRISTAVASSKRCTIKNVPGSTAEQLYELLSDSGAMSVRYPALVCKWVHACMHVCVRACVRACVCVCV